MPNGGFMQYLTPEDRLNAATLSFTSGMAGKDGVGEAMGFVNQIIGMKHQQEQESRAMAAESDTRGFLSAWLGGEQDQRRLLEMFPNVDPGAVQGFIREALEERRHARNVEDQVRVYQKEREIDDTLRQGQEGRAATRQAEYGQARFALKQLRDAGVPDSDLAIMAETNPALAAALDEDLTARRIEEKDAATAAAQLAAEQARVRRERLMERIQRARLGLEGRRVRAFERRTEEIERHNREAEDEEKPKKPSHGYIEKEVASMIGMDMGEVLTGRGIEQLKKSPELQKQVFTFLLARAQESKETNDENTARQINSLLVKLASLGIKREP